MCILIMYSKNVCATFHVILHVLLGISGQAFNNYICYVVCDIVLL